MNKIKKTILTLGILVAMTGIAEAITKAETDSVITARFADKFGTNYSQNVQVYDGTFFFLATALARSGRIELGFCGYDLISPSIAATTETGVDSAGAIAEGCTILDMSDYAGIASTYDAQQRVNNFFSQTVEDTALIGVGSYPIPTTKNITSRLRFQNPNNGKDFNVFGSPNIDGTIIKIYNIQGQYITMGQIYNGKAHIREQVGIGKYILITKIKIGKNTYSIKESITIVY